MRDIVGYHRARLDYDATDVLDNPNNALRRKMLQEIADDESVAVLRRAYQNYRGQAEDQIVSRLLSGKTNIDRRLSVLFFAWKIGADEDALDAWLKKNKVEVDGDKLSKLFKAYKNPRLTAFDHAYLMGLHPLDLWCAGEFRKQPKLSWEDLYAHSAQERRSASSWLLSARQRKAQDLRLRIRLEKDAFTRMTPYWQRVGFPFKTLVPSYATSIGSSSDRPVALAELVGILINDGVRREPVSITKVHFASGTPYETVFERSPGKGERVLAPEIARAIRKAMSEVVEQGTARRLAGVFHSADGKPITVGGKTGSGDNKFETFNKYGGVLTSRSTNRTATFVFYIGNRYYGVITAYVQGREAANYHFTSGLPVNILRIMAPAVMENMNGGAGKSMAVEQMPAKPAASADQVSASKLEVKY
jgi:cell division protein FtsI/penicillin-binding protein 2